ncbi:MAG: hypothetical protein JW751_06445 [Polyangiaceae bacterium]|nr:hypothetical protein [Polyangiaceae bacterium]
MAARWRQDHEIPAGCWRRATRERRPGVRGGIGGLALALLGACGARSELVDDAAEGRRIGQAGSPARGGGGRPGHGSGGSLASGGTRAIPFGGSGSTSIPGGGGGTAADGTNAGVPAQGAGAGFAAGAAAGGVAPEGGDGPAAAGGSGAHGGGGGPGGWAGEPTPVAGGGGGDAGAAGQSAVRSLTIEPDALADARLGRAYAAHLSARGGSNDGYRFALGGGTLPLGLILGADGAVAGTPSEAGDFAFMVTVTDAFGAQVSEQVTLHVDRTRWMYAAAFPSSASSQVLILIQDLLNEGSPIVTLDAWTRGGRGFSPDGRWLYYDHRRDTMTEIFVIDTSGDKLGDPISLGEVTGSPSCSWSPDSTQLACAAYATTEVRIMVFDPSRSGTAPVEYLAAAGRPPSWVGDRTFAYTDLAEEIQLVDMSDAAIEPPAATGVLGKLHQVGTGGDRAVVERVPEDTTTIEWGLMDLATFAHGALPVHDGWVFSPSLEAAVAADFGASAAEPATYFYYALDGIRAELLGTREVAEPENSYRSGSPSGKFAGKRFFELRNGIPAVTAFDAADLTTILYADELPEVDELTASPDGRWLAFRRAGALPNDPDAGTWWIARVLDDSIEPATALEPTAVGAYLRFSPDSSKVIVVGHDTYGAQDVAQPAMLHDLSSPSGIAQHPLALPYDRSIAGWSSDSSYVGFLGTDPLRSARALYVVDALDPGLAPRLVLSCSSNPASLPGCPMGFGFQP